MARPTIKDVALQAGVSVSTVNRVLHEPEKVRESMVRNVLEAAEKIGFYGILAMKSSIGAARPKLRIGVVLLQQNRALYHSLGALIDAAAANYSEAQIETEFEYLDDLAPEIVAGHIERLAEKCDSIALVSPEHPVVTLAVEKVTAQGTAVFALISSISADCPVGFIGMDYWKVGRTAAWFFSNLMREPGKIGVLVGNHRFRNQELNESGFRSYFREHPIGETILDPISTFESATIAREITERLLAEQPDLKGLFISGGGITGALTALKESGRGREIVSLGYDLTDATRAALLDGTLNVVIAHPMREMARRLIDAMARASQTGSQPVKEPVIPFQIHTPENL
jgi:LacI family transcriptional regulator, galactose operon repressor